MNDQEHNHKETTHMQWLFPISLFLGITFLLLAPVSLISAEHIVAAYYENFSQYRPPAGNRQPFSPKMIDTNILTDLYYAFAGFGYVTKSVNPSNPHLTGDFTIQPMEGNDQSVLYPQILKLKQESKNGLRTFLSIGGWNFNDPNDSEGMGKNTYRLFSEMVSNSANRKQFIDSAIAYAHRYGFDGIDIDWEYPGDVSRGGTIDDFNNFIEFLKECSAAFSQAEPRLYLSYAAPPFVPVGLPKNFQEDPDSYFKWLAQCAQYLDRMNVMAYDYHGPFDDPKITGANSPLNRDTNPKSNFYIAKTLENYLNNGVPANKIVLGMPTFGHSFAGVTGLSSMDNGPGKLFQTAGAPGPSTGHAGLLAYFEISDMIKQKHLTFGADPVTSTAYGYHISHQTWVSFDTPDTIKLKAQMALDKNLRGVMFWAVDMDEYQWEPRYPNIRNAWNVFQLPSKDLLQIEKSID